jgi:hypothetical protein
VQSIRIDHRRSARLLALGATIALAALALWLVGSAAAEAPPGPTRLVYAPGEIVPIPAAIPHEEGDMVDKRILPDLRWIAKRFPIYITDGYSGPLPDGEHVGCDECHVKGSEHYNGLAVDIVPLEPSSRCDAHWTEITRLALWAEPVQNQPRPPFRWVGYEGDAGHGCGNHLHLSWNHAVVAQFQLAEWVEVFPTGKTVTTEPPRKHRVKPAAPQGPPGGISQVMTGGLSPRGHGD